MASGASVITRKLEVICQLLMMSLKGTRPLQYIDHYSNGANSYMILINQPRPPHWLGTSASWNVASVCARARRPCWRDFCFSAHACAAPFESLCVCQAKRCGAALIRPGKADGALLDGDSSLYQSIISMRRQWPNMDSWEERRNKLQASPTRPVNAIVTRNPDGR